MSASPTVSLRDELLVSQRDAHDERISVKEVFARARLWLTSAFLDSPDDSQYAPLPLSTTRIVFSRI